jgi:branched-chain amino acid transport system substrate-binding protein
MFRRGAALFLAAMMMVVIAGCGTKSTKGAVKIGLIVGLTGPLEAWGKDVQRGFEIGLDYATGGKREVAGRKIEVIVKDDQNKTDVGKQMAIELFEKDQVDILAGIVNSAIALQVLPLLEQYKKVAVIDPAASAAITTSAFTRYAFRTGSNTDQDALAGARGAAGLGKKVVQLAPDYDWGRTSAAGWKKLIEEAGSQVVFEVFPPQETQDFLPFLKQVEAQKADVLVVHWAGYNAKLTQQIAQLGLYKSMKVTGGIADMRAMKQLPKDAEGAMGMVKYFHTLPKNKANDYLVAEYKKRHNEAPELFSAGGFNAAVAIIEALKKTNGETDAEKLISTLEGMSFEGAKGTMTFRKEDHQAIQTMYVVQLAMNAGFDFLTPKLVKELSPQETAPPVNVKK